MTIGSFIFKNALRNKRRTLLSILSVAVSLFLLMILLVALHAITTPTEDAGAELRVAVRSKISIANLLPVRQLPIIEKIPGVEAVTPFTWFGGKYKNEEGMTFAQFAMDAKKLRAVFTEAHMDQAAYDAFEAERTACIIGKISAEKYKLKVGDKISLESTVYPVTMEFKIVGIYAGTADDRNMLFRQDYLDEASGAKGQVGMWWLKVSSAEVMPTVLAAINKAFENTSAEVRAETEHAFQLSFISMWGNIKLLVTLICSAVVFTLLLVSASTMSMAIRERFRELAILKALGFRRRELFAFILAESFGLAAVGALIGIGGVWLLMTYATIAASLFCFLAICLGAMAIRSIVRKKFFDVVLNLFGALFLAGMGCWVFIHPNVATMTNGMFPALVVTPTIAGIGALVAALLGIAASILPSLAVARVSVVDGFKTLD